MQLYLRIALELHLKRLIVGGMERVFEIGRIFRNEGISTRHNEFTMMELYQAFADWTDVMDITERLITNAARDAIGSTTLSIQGDNVDLADPWPRIRMIDAASEAIGTEIHPSMRVMLLPTSHRRMMSKWHHSGCGQNHRGNLRGSLRIRHREAPLSPAIPSIFLPYLGCIVMIHSSPSGSSSSLTGANLRMDIPTQRSSRATARFEDEQSAKEAGDLEHGTVDEDYLRALEYGMPQPVGLALAWIVSQCSSLALIRSEKLFCSPPFDLR